MKKKTLSSVSVCSLSQEFRSHFKEQEGSMIFRKIKPTPPILRQKKCCTKKTIILLYDATLLSSLTLNPGIRSGLLLSGIHSNTTYAFLARSTVAKNAYELRNVRPSVRSSARISAAPTGQISVKFVIGDFMKICREILDLVKIGQK